MALLGRAALAMWWRVADAVRSDFEHWHAHEHFPERLSVPGFRRATRFADVQLPEADARLKCVEGVEGVEGSQGVFVLYELDDFEVLSSPGYAARLNAPTPWSTRMMPHHQSMVRSQCRVLFSEGAVTARHALSVRLSPAVQGGADLRSSLHRLGIELRQRPGLVGLHLLRHDAPPIEPTREQQMRGHADRVADHVLIACGWDLDALRALSSGSLGDAALAAAGAAPGVERRLHQLAYSATPTDVA